MEYKAMWSYILFCLVVATPVIIQATVDDDSKIIGGTNTTIQEHPYQVSCNNNNKGLCGGFIISKNYIVTAAHCTVNAVPSKMYVRAGSTFRNGTLLPIAEITTHPNYNKGAKVNNDITIMKTTKEINFTDSIKAIALPPLNRDVTGVVTLIGWGNTKFGVSTSATNRLMHGNLTVFSYNACKSKYGPYMTENMFCAGKYAGPYGCQGDSGGPAVQSGMVVGIDSFGMNCGEKPTVFAKVSAASIRNFITKVTGL